MRARRRAGAAQPDAPVRHPAHPERRRAAARRRARPRDLRHPRPVPEGAHELAAHRASWAGSMRSSRRSRGSPASTRTRPCRASARLVYFDTPATAAGNPNPNGDTNPNTMTTSNFLSGHHRPRADDGLQPDARSPTPTARSSTSASCSTFADTDPRRATRGSSSRSRSSGSSRTSSRSRRRSTTTGSRSSSSTSSTRSTCTGPTRRSRRPSATRRCRRPSARWCSQDGAVTYEPLLADVLTNTDLFQTLHDTVPDHRGDHGRSTATRTDPGDAARARRRARSTASRCSRRRCA